MTIIALNKPEHFSFVNKFGTKYNSKTFFLIICKNFSLIPSNNINNYKIFLGMKVSKKFSKKAVIRNKVKRRARSIIHILLKQFGNKVDNFAVVFVPKYGFDKSNFAQINKEFYVAFLKAML